MSEKRDSLHPAKRRLSAEILLFGAGLLLAFGACVVSRFARPDWTGAIAGALGTLAVVAAFVAGLVSHD